MKILIACEESQTVCKAFRAKGEIKFRAWNIPTKQMLYWGFFHDVFQKGATDSRNFEPEHNEFMQFTGLLDKNGKDIYEGDILKVGESGLMNMTAKNYEVKWCGENDYPAFDLAGWEDDEVNALSALVQSGDWEYEVIGNVLENPELLTPKN